MHKFDDFLSGKTKEEAEEFFVPESFDLRIEKTLEDLPKKNRNEKVYLNKKLIGMAACFAFVILTGIVITPNTNENARQAEVASDRAAMPIEEEGPQFFSMSPTILLISDVDTIENLNFKSLKDEPKYKFINKKDDVKIIIDSINSLVVENIEPENISEWDFLIQTNGRVNNSIMIKDNYININENWYKANENIAYIIEDIYSIMNYEEKDIKYCNVN